MTKPKVRFKTVEEIKAQCKAQGLAFTQFAELTSVRVAGGDAKFYYNAKTGLFEGDVGGMPHSSLFNSTKRQPWYQKLCAFFWHVEEVPAASYTVKTNPGGFVAGFGAVNVTIKPQVKRSPTRLHRMAQGVLAANRSAA